MRIIYLYIRFIYELSYCVLFSLKVLMVLMEVFRSYFFDVRREWYCYLVLLGGLLGVKLLRWLMGVRGVEARLGAFESHCVLMLLLLYLIYLLINLPLFLSFLLLPI